MSLAPALRRSGVFKDCRKLAAELLGAKHVWCHFDHLIYKHPGAARVAWHQDLASSKTGLLERAVHFWIPLHDLTPESGCMMFAPGCPSRELLRHVPQHEVGGTAIRIDPGKGEFEFVTKTLPMGGFSVHSPRTVHASAANQSDDLRKASDPAVRSRLGSTRAGRDPTSVGALAPSPLDTRAARLPGEAVAAGASTVRPCPCPGGKASVLALDSEANSSASLAHFVHSKQADLLD